jgi:hypothetical protein
MRIEIEMKEMGKREMKKNNWNNLKLENIEKEKN